MLACYLLDKILAYLHIRDREFSLKRSYPFLLILAATFKSSSTSCQITDKGVTRQENYEDTVCKHTVIRHGRPIASVCHGVMKTRDIYLGPTTIRCSNTSFDELNQFNAKTDTKNRFYVNESSINTLAIDNKNWSRLTEITLENVNISGIVPGFFNGFTDLTLLSIPHNNITELADGMFSALTNLINLNLSYNLISNIEPMALIGLPKLNTLDLRHNKILTMPPKLLTFQSNLTYLDLSDNWLHRVNDIHIPSLHTLLIHNNNISVFNFPNNMISKLEVVDLSSNIITEIENFEQFKANRVDLSFNHIEILDRLGEIDYINLSHNYLRSIDKGFVQDKVVSLDLSFNFIDNIATAAFNNGSNIKVLILSNNKLKELSTGTFKNQKYLERLDLSNNNILYFEFGLFNDLKHLKYLNISFNEGIVDFQTLFRLSQLEELDFEGNEPKNFDDFFFATHQKLKTIRMGYNTLNCRELVRIIYLMESQNITVLEGLNHNEVHVNGISCDSDLKSVHKKNVTEEQVEKEASGKEKFVNASHDLQYIQVLNSTLQVLSKFKGLDEPLETSLESSEEEVLKNALVLINVNLIVCNILLLLISCSLIFIFLHIKHHSKSKYYKEQVELL